MSPLHPLPGDWVARGDVTCSQMVPPCICLPRPSFSPTQQLQAPPTGAQAHTLDLILRKRIRFSICVPNTVLPHHLPVTSAPPASELPKFFLLTVTSDSLTSSPSSFPSCSSSPHFCSSPAQTTQSVPAITITWSLRPRRAWQTPNVVTPKPLATRGQSSGILLRNNMQPR